MSLKFPSRIGSLEQHEELVKEILLTISKTQLARAWENKTGAAYRRKQLIYYGLKGSADILGILADGRFLAIECKTGKARQTKEQRNFQRMIETFNGVYIIARSVVDIKNFFQNKD
jgi:hypothetical protein